MGKGIELKADLLYTSCKPNTYLLFSSINMIPTTLKRLITNSVLYMVIALIGTIVAILENRPANASGFSTGLPVVRDFL